MPHTKRQAPPPPRASTYEITAATAVAGAGAYLALVHAGPQAAVGYLVCASGLFILALFERRRHARDWRSVVQGQLDALGEEVELTRREVVAMRIDRERQEAKAARRPLPSGRSEQAGGSNLEVLDDFASDLRGQIEGLVGTHGTLLEPDYLEGHADQTRLSSNSARALFELAQDVHELTCGAGSGPGIDEQDFWFDDCVQSVVEEWATRLQRCDRTLCEAVDQEIPAQVCGDQPRLRRTLDAFLRGAVSLTNAGELKVDARMAEESPDGHVVRIAISGQCDSPLSAAAGEPCSVSDEGLGVTIDLAVACRLAERMGGLAGVESADGGFRAWFSVCLRRRGSAGLVDSGEFAAREPGAVHLLLIDPSEQARADILACTSSRDSELDVARTAAEAISKLKAAAAVGVPFDIALMDWDLPDMNGRDLCEVFDVLPEACDLKRILLQPPGSSLDPVEVARAGFDSCISRPVTRANLVKALRRVRLESTERGGAAGIHREPEPIDAIHARTLIVDGNQVDQEVTSLLLRRLSCRVEVAASGSEAIERLRAETFDVVLMDCQLPDMDGPSATHEIRHIADASRSSVPVIGMLTESSPEAIARCRGAGMIDCLTKPVRPEELEAAVRRWAPIAAEQTSPRPTMEGQGESPLDPVVIQSLKEIGGGDRHEVFHELVELFLEDTPGRIDALVEALQAQDHDELASVAHSLKGSCCSLGALRLSSIFGQIEHCGRSADLVDVSCLIDRCKGEFTQVVEALRVQLR